MGGIPDPAELRSLEALKDHFGVTDREPDMIVEHPTGISISDHSLLVLGDDALDYYYVFKVACGEGGVYEPSSAFGGRID